MKCCASQTISTASQAGRVVTESGRGGDEASVAFTALLTSLTLRPLAKPLGFYGETVVDACAQSIARALPFRIPLAGDGA